MDRTDKIERLNVASARRIVEPDTEVPGHVGDGQLLPDDLLSIAGLDLDLTAEQRATLSREEIASITDMGVRFECVLMAGFCLQLTSAEDLTDPRVIYALHEVGEETRHSRLFSRLIGQIKPKAKNPMNKPILRRLERFGLNLIIRRPALLDVLVLGGEEIPDLFQKLASEHPDTDPFVKAVNKYHRMEEARHLAYARTVLPERWAEATWTDRFAVRHIAPLVIGDMFRFIVHPGVYATVGLPAWETWKAAQQTPQRRALRHEATRGVLKALVEGDVFRPGRIPKRWQQLCGVDRHGKPLADAPTLSAMLAQRG
ncbi:MAG: hypothetical protein QOG64_371 [Acidimicrobiaceae bacterium]|nr:hypothetical protein [Acidimicrobiaceae bacterium]